MQAGWRWMKRAPLLLALVSFMAPAQQVLEVVIENYAYRPQELKVRPGDTVRWSNRERRTSHSILFPGDEGLESERLFPGESWQRTFLQPGAYPYNCGPHPEMKGVILVVPE